MTLPRLPALPLVAALSAALLSGCATTQGPPDERDPLEGFNRAVHGFNTAFDETIGKPVARGYKAVAPEPVDKGVTNFFSNLNDIGVTFNNLLQGKVGDAASDTGRLLVNTTFGIFGIIDVATPLGLEKHEEDFGQTLGVWGAGPGAYLVLPFFGPRTVRDTAGLVVDTLFMDQVYEIDDVGTRNALLAVRLIDQRADLLKTTNIVETAALDQYAFVRDAYLQRRQFLVYDGDPPEEPEDEDIPESGLEPAP
jgi:phospholipid-binding lipoprotein MlaA